MIIGVDTGGTKTAVGLFSNNGDLVTTEQFPTPIRYTDYLDKTSKSINSLINQHPIESICIALPGTIQNEILITAGNLQEWGVNIPVLTDFQARIPNKAISIENDANLGGLGEVYLMKNAPASSLYITISTGIGGGFIYNGQLLEPTKRAEIGDIIIFNNGRLETWENTISGKAIFERYHLLAKDIQSPQTWEDISQSIGQGLLSIIPTLVPDVIIFGGSVGACFDKFSQPLLDYVSKNIADQNQLPIFKKAINPKQAVLYGCYFYARDHK